MEGTHLKNNRSIAQFRRAPLVAGILLTLAWSLPCLAETEGPAGLAAQAEQAYDKGQWEEALEHYTRLAQQAPDPTEMLFRIGNLHARLGRLLEAAESYERALAGNPRHARSRHNLGVVRVRQAIAELSQAQVDVGTTVLPSRRLIDDLEFALGRPQDEPACSAPEVQKPPIEAAVSVNSPVVYSTARINLRDGPGKSFARLATVPADTALTLLARQEHYAQVATPAGQTGWLPLYLLRLGSEPASEKTGDGR